MTVNEDLCSLMSDYVHLEGNVKSVYKLRSTSELGDDVEVPPAPTAPVYPPELPKGMMTSVFRKIQTKITLKTRNIHKWLNGPRFGSKAITVVVLALFKTRACQIIRMLIV